MSSKDQTSTLSPKSDSSVQSTPIQSSTSSTTSVLSVGSSASAISLTSISSWHNTGNSSSQSSVPFTTTKKMLTRGNSSLQDSYSLSSNQNASALSRGTYSIEVASSTIPKQTSRQTPNLQGASLTSQPFSSSRSVLTISSPTSMVSKSSVLGFYEILPDGSSTTVNITTTITSPPSGFSTISASNSLWTGDTTTQSGGTIYPVIYGCLVCGSKHHGIILTGLGGLPSEPKRTGCGSGIASLFRSYFGCGSAFKFPPLWSLPPFIVGPLGNPIPEEAQPDLNDPEPDPEEKQQT